MILLQILSTHSVKETGTTTEDLIGTSTSFPPLLPQHDQTNGTTAVTASGEEGGDALQALNTTSGDVIDSFYFYEVSDIPCPFPRTIKGPPGDLQMREVGLSLIRNYPEILVASETIDQMRY